VTDAPPGRVTAAARWQTLRGPALVAAAAGAAVTWVALVDPSRPGRYPTCPFLQLTGHVCPGCGTLRAVHALAHGDLGAAAGLNLLAVAAVPLLAALWLRWSAARLDGRWLPRLPAVAIWAPAALTLTFWLVRNLPFGASLAP
jgi:hypothetical protein